MFLHKNHFAWSRGLAVCTCLSLTLLGACSDDDSTADPDTDLPSITITGLQANATIWNTVSITVTAEDNKAVKEVELLVDNKSVVTKTEKTFSYALNTTDPKLADGQHTLTAIVTDDSGNEKKQDIPFTVLNTLVSIDVPGGLLKGQERGFIFLSDAAGKVIVSQEYENNEKIRLTAPAFDGADFYLTEVLIDISNDHEELATYQKVNRGTWVLTPLYTEDTPVVAGQANISFTLGLPGIEYTVRAGDDHIVTAGDDTRSRSLKLHKNPSKLYISRREDDALATHYLLVPVSVGTNDPIDLSKVSTKLTEVPKDLSDYGYSSGYTSINGLETSGDVTAAYEVFSTYFDDVAMNYRYPGNAFTSYISYVDAVADGKFHVYNLTDGFPDFEPLATDINVEFKNNKFTGTVTGDDVDMIRFDIEADGNTAWIISAARGAVDIVIPELPVELQAIITLEEPKPAIQFYAWEKFSFDGYDGFLNFIRNSTRGALELDSDGATYKQLEIQLTPDPLGRRAQARK